MNIIFEYILKNEENYLNNQTLFNKMINKTNINLIFLEIIRDLIDYKKR